MFDIGWQELFVLAVLAIIVIGPKDLPRAMRAITRVIRKARSMARDLQDGLDEVAREAELDDLKNELDRPGGLDVGKRIGEAIDPTGEIAGDMDLDKDLYDEMSDAAEDLKQVTAPDAKDEDKDEPKNGNAAGDEAKSEAETAKAGGAGGGGKPKAAREASG